MAVCSSLSLYTNVSSVIFIFICMWIDVAEGQCWHLHLTGSCAMYEWDYLTIDTYIPGDNPYGGSFLDLDYCKTWCETEGAGRLFVSYDFGEPCYCFSICHGSLLYDGYNTYKYAGCPTSSPSPRPTSSTMHPTGSTMSPTRSTINPTLSTSAPTLIPTPNPSITPTVTPTMHPTVTPSTYPTNNPSQSPSNKPSLYPSTTPTERPSVIPTIYPTTRPSQSISPSNNPTRNVEQTTTDILLDYDEKQAEQQRHESKLDVLNVIYQSTAGGFVLLCVLTTLTGYIDSRWIRSNDYFNYVAIGAMMFATLDMTSDCFFAVEVSIQRNIYVDLQLQMRIIFYGSVLFIALPALVALFQLYFYTKKHWLKEDRVISWIHQYMVLLLLFSIVTGNAFAAISLMNSGLYNMEVFDMGLTNNQLRTFNIRRMYSIVFLENVPQVCLQSYYIWISEDIDNPITISSIIFSMISIIISTMRLTIEKQINYQQKHVMIWMDVTGDCVTQNRANCKTLCRDLKQELATYIGINAKTIEIIKPTDIKDGVEVQINITLNDKHRKEINYEQIFEHPDVAKLFEENWKLRMDKEAKLVIGNVNVVFKESKQQTKKTPYDPVKTHMNPTDTSAEMDTEITVLQKS